MPELPELEVARKNLQRWLAGANVTAVAAPRSLVLKGTPKSLVGKHVDGVERRGKWLRFAIGDRIVFSHFGMTGRWVKRPLDAPEERWEKVRLDVEKGKRTYSLRYVDPRMLGRFIVAREDVPAWTELGPDPLRDDIDPVQLHETMQKTRRTVKEVLMDQTVLAGVGNIQATDALFLAKIRPDTIANRLEIKDVRAIVRAVHRSIERTLALEEGPEITYVEDAGAPNPFIIYGRGGEPCPKCGTTLVRTVIGGRGSVYCPKDQPATSGASRRARA